MLPVKGSPEKLEKTLLGLLNLQSRAFPDSQMGKIIAFKI